MDFISLKPLFKESKMSIAEISRKTNINYSTVYHYVSDDIQKPTECYYKPIYDLLSKIDNNEDVKQDVIGINNTSQLEYRYQEPQSGEVYYIKNRNSIGSEFRGDHYAIIVGNDRFNKNSNAVKIVYLTSKKKPNMPTHVVLQIDNQNATALCEQIHTIDKSRIIKFICRISSNDLALINKALMISLDLNYVKDNFNEENKGNLNYEILKTERNIYKKFYDDIMKNELISLKKE